MNKMREREKKHSAEKKFPDFRVGDTVRVWTRIKEADKIRVHPFEGIVIAKKNKGLSSSFTVRRISYGEGMEKVFPLYTPSIEKIEVIKKAKFKRARLYYLRKRL
jgi:large subunit ribosomal protein L19